MLAATQSPSSAPCHVVLTELELPWADAPQPVAFPVLWPVLYMCFHCVLVTQSCLTLCDPMEIFTRLLCP